MEKVLVISCAQDFKFSKNASYLLENHLDDVKAGAEKYAATIGASSILYFLENGSKDYGLENVAFGMNSPTNSNAYSIVQQLKGDLPRPMIQDDFVATLDGKEYAVLTIGAAFALVKPEIRVFTVASDDSTEVKEVPVGTKLSDVICTENAKAVLIGGQQGKFILPQAASEIVLDNSFLFNFVYIVPKSACMVALMSSFMSHCWEKSCGKCVLCREGSLQSKVILEDLALGKAKSTDIELLKDITPLIKAGAYCPFGQTWPETLKTGIELFSAEFEAHAKKKCLADVCFKAGSLYAILPDKCTGCTDCIDECNYTAIEGKKGFIHMIDQDMCEHCGECVDKCPEEAIVMVEGKLPKLPKKLTRVGKF